MSAEGASVKKLERELIYFRPSLSFRSDLTTSDNWDITTKKIADPCTKLKPSQICSFLIMLQNLEFISHSESPGQLKPCVVLYKNM